MSLEKKSLLLDSAEQNIFFGLSALSEIYYQNC